MKRVGFVLSYTDSTWMGGINYLSNLMHAVARIPDRQIEPVLIVPPEAPAKLLANFPPTPVLRTPLVDLRQRERQFARKLLERGLGCDYLMQRYARSQHVDVLSHSGQLGARASLPTIGWLADFQHLRMPEFFEATEIVARDHDFRRVIAHCSTMVLSSEDAQRDLAKFAPAAVAKSRVLHFVAGFAGGETPLVDESILRQRYTITGPYLHLPNQFWAHKNHRVVIDALAVLKGRGRPAVVLSTGHTEDKRWPAYFGDLMRHAEQVGVADCFRVLGLVPYEDLASLMRYAVAVVNPSLFEGWSTTVEESKSLGLTIVLSDIAVHREQAPERGVFFEARNPESLADAIAGVLDHYSPQDEQVHRARAWAALPARFAAFGAQYQSIVLHTCAHAG